MKRELITGMLALLCASTLVGAQAQPGAGQPQTAPRPNQTAPAPAAQGAHGTMTLVGCLYRENQIHGRTPNVSERAGVLEDYVLADALPPGSATESAKLSTGTMYKVEKIADEKLKAMVGKRVEVTGRIDPEGGEDAVTSRTGGGPTKDKGLGPDDINLPEFEASSIRGASGTCPATPADHK